MKRRHKNELREEMTNPTLNPQEEPPDPKSLKRAQILATQKHRLMTSQSEHQPEPVQMHNLGPHT